MATKLLQVRIDEELLKEFKIKLLKEDRKIKEVIEKLIKEYLDTLYLNLGTDEETGEDLTLTF